MIVTSANSGAHGMREAGVSLLEVLAALAILALVTGTVVVMMRPEDAPHRVEGETLLRALYEARQDALVTGQPVGFGTVSGGQGYAFYRFEDAGWTVRTDHPAFDTRRFEHPDLVLSVVEGAITARDQAETRDSPEVWFDPTGLDTGFVYELRSADGLVLLSRNGQGRLALTDPESGAEL